MTRVLTRRDFIAMEIVMDNQLFKLYQELVDAGLVVPVYEVGGQFRYPTALVPVRSFTSYGVGDTSGLSEEQIAQLARHSK